jgi:hypothetical protein
VLIALVDREELLRHLLALGNPLLRVVRWNRQPIPLLEATARAERLPDGTRVAVCDSGVYASPER